METVLAITAFITTVWALSLWHTNKMLCDLISNRDEEEKEPENPNQMKPEFDEEDHH